MTTATELIQPAAVERDEQGYWSHPGIPNFDEDTQAFRAWYEAQGLTLHTAILEHESVEHPNWEKYFADGEPGCAGWTPTPPLGVEWFTLSIHDTEDGPMWVWACRLKGNPR